MKKRMRILASLLCMTMLLTSVVSPALAAETAVPLYDEVTAASDGSDVDNIIELSGGQWEISPLEETTGELLGEDTIYCDDDIVKVIVVLEEEPLLRAAEEIGLSSDMPAYLATAGGSALDKRLKNSHTTVRSQIMTLCKGTEVSSAGHDYTAVLNGFSMDMPYGMIKEAEKIKGVKRICLVEYYSVPEDMSSFDLAMENSNGMIGAEEVYSNMSFAGHDGAGAIVAILDTGLDTDHEAFLVMPETVRYTRTDIQNLMNRTTLSSGITKASETYVNAKVPYAYDYADGDTDVNGNINHGVHVAGTVAGNNGEDFFGVAPNAQLMIMKVFSDNNGSANSADITAGLDDAVKLGADAINMSLGSAAGFTWNRETESEVYNNCWDAGINLMVAAGNDTNSTYGNRYGNNKAQTDSLDNAIVSTPSTGYGAMSVASVQNSAAAANYFLLGAPEEDNKVSFNQMISATNGSLYNFFKTLRIYAENTYTKEYVVVPGLGEEEDYDGLDVNGKIALIKRGVINFDDKANIAKNHGAVAAIIYNNLNETFYPGYSNFTIPMVGISLSDGERLIAAAGEGNNTVTFGPALASDYHWTTPEEEKIPWVAVLPSSDGGKISSFSSIGPGTDLTLKPEISAPGGNIVSADIGGGYVTMSGTSMATPHMAGAAAVVRNYVRNELGITDAQEIRDISEALMMSTAVPAQNGDGVEYSPRWQGAGIVNVRNAVTAESYLTVDGVDDSNLQDAISITRPKAELGWNEDGVYAFSFYVHNISDRDMTYTLYPTSLSEGIITEYGLNFSDGMASRLDGDDFTMTFSCGNSVTIPAGKTVAVNAMLTLSDHYKTQLFENFENGNYVEGFVYLQPIEGVTLALPYLGYCGDWLNAGTVFEGAPDTDWQLQPTLFATSNINGAGTYLGDNAYTDTYNYNRLAFSPILNHAQQYLATILTTRRNLTDFSMRITNADGEVMWELGTPYLTKSYYNASYRTVINTQIVTNGWTGRYWNEKTGAYDGDLAPAGQYYYTFSGNTGQNDEGYTEVTWPLWLDGGGPEITNVQTYVDAEDGIFKLSFDVQDDHYVRVIRLIDSTNTWLLDYAIDDFATLEPQGSKSRVIIDLNELCQFLADNGLNPGRVKLVASDYSLNDGYVYVDLGPQYMSLSNMTVAKGDSQAMSLRILPAELAGQFELTWSSSDETIATVDEKGVITGVEYGTATITVTANSGLSAQATVTVGNESQLPEDPEIPEENPNIVKPSAEADPDIWDSHMEASDSKYLNQRFQYEGLWYKVTGADTVQLIKAPDVTIGYSATYPDAGPELIIPETVSYEGKTFTVTTIGEYAFYYCTQLTSVTLPDTIRVIGDYAFMMGYNYNSAKLTSMNLPEGLEEIGISALYGNRNMDFKLPSTLRYIGANAFNYTGITELSFGPAIESIGDQAFAYCLKLVQAEMPAAAQNTEGLFMQDIALAKVEIEQGITHIPAHCFYLCRALQTVELPDSVTEICYGALSNTGLTDLCLEGTNVTTIGDLAYSGLTDCYDLVIPDSVTYVGSLVFYLCRSVRSVTVGANVAYMGDQVMTSFLSLHPDVTAVIPEVKSATAGIAVRRSGYVGPMTKNGVSFDAYAGAPFTIDGITYMPISATEVMVTSYDPRVVTGVVTIPATVTCEGDEITYTVTAVADRLFSQMYYITEIHLPDTITTVGARSFDQVRALEYINIPSSLTTITGIQAFGYGGWDNLVWSGIWNPDTLVIPGTLKTWNKSAFAGNRYTSAVLEEGLHAVGELGLSYSANLTDVQMASTVQYLKNRAFAFCPSLTSLELPEGLLYIGTGVFEDTPLKQVSLPDSLQYIGSKAFSAYTYDDSTYPAVATYVGLEEITIPGGVIGMGWNAFEGNVTITTTLGSQRNLVIERNDMDEDNLPTVCWDGRTDIPEGDYSVVPAGVTVRMDKDAGIDGGLIVEGTLIISCQTRLGDNVIVKGEVITEHYENELRNAKEATCTEEGSTGDIYCSDCDELLQTGQVIPAAGHTYTAVVTAPTCTDDGYTTYTCHCGDSYVDDYVDALGHNFGDWKVTKPADCFNDGERIRTCACGETETESIPATSENCPSNAFADLDATKWYHRDMDYVLKNGFMIGIGDNRFGPNTSMTRGMLVTTLYRLAGEPAVQVETRFTDVPQGRYFTQAVAWAEAEGIAKGVTADIFAPDSTVTREQAATFLYRYITEYLKQEPAGNADLSVYQDAGRISAYAEGPVAWATAAGLFEGFPGGIFQPQGALTRVQMAKLLAVLDQSF